MRTTQQEKTEETSIGDQWRNALHARGDGSAACPTYGKIEPDVGDEVVAEAIIEDLPALVEAAIRQKASSVQVFNVAVGHDDARCGHLVTLNEILARENRPLSADDLNGVPRLIAVWCIKHGLEPYITLNSGRLLTFGGKLHIRPKGIAR